MSLLERRQQLGCQVTEHQRVTATLVNRAAQLPCFLLLHDFYHTSISLFFTAPARPGNRMSIATPSSSDNTVAIIGGVVAVVLIIAVTTAIILIVIVALVLRSRRSHFSPNQK